MLQQRIQEVKAKVAQCIAKAQALYGITLPQVTIRFDLKGRAAGIAGYKGFERAYYLRFNTQMMTSPTDWDHLINDTVPHEVAHTVCQAFPKFGNNHNTGWKRVCMQLGGTGKRCYSTEDAPEQMARLRPFTYTTTAGHTVSVTKSIHRKIQQGQNYTARSGGQLTSACSYSLTQTQPAREVPKTVTPKQQSTTGASKADRVRDQIAHQKAEFGSEAFERVIAWAVYELGMSPALARTYVKNNWYKA